MRRINSLYGRIGFLRRVPENSTKQSHNTFLASLSFSTDGAYGGGGGGEQNSSRVKIFDRDLKRIHRDRAAWLSRHKTDTFVDAVAENLLDRLEDCKKSFPSALCLGGSLGAVKRLLRGRGGIEKLTMMDTSYDMIKSCRDAQDDSHDNSIETSYLVGDEEFLPIKESSVENTSLCSFPTTGSLLVFNQALISRTSFLGDQFRLEHRFSAVCSPWLGSLVHGVLKTKASDDPRSMVGEKPSYGLGSRSMWFSF